MNIRRTDKTWKKVGEEVFILDGQNELTHSLNETAAWFWMVLASESHYEKLLRQFIDVYDVDMEIAQNDLDELVKQLKAKGLVTIDG